MSDEMAEEMIRLREQLMRAETCIKWFSDWAADELGKMPWQIAWPPNHEDVCVRLWGNEPTVRPATMLHERG